MRLLWYPVRRDGASEDLSIRGLPIFAVGSEAKMGSGSGSVFGEESGDGIAGEQANAGKDCGGCAEVPPGVAVDVEIFADVFYLGLQLGGSLVKNGAFGAGAVLKFFDRAVGWRRCRHSWVFTSA